MKLRKLTRKEYGELEELYIAVLEAEENILPIGRHYMLTQKLYELGFGLELDKLEAKRMAQELMDYGYE